MRFIGFFIPYKEKMMVRQKLLAMAAALLGLGLGGQAAAGEYVTKADQNWVELPVTQEIVKDSILDFSKFTNDAPAGKHGRLVVNKQTGHWEFEKRPGKKVRLVGNNLCYGGNYLSKEEVDKLAVLFQRMGYNTMRLHHYDVDLIKGNWNATKSDDIDPAQLDKLDYMFAKLKEHGMYITIDLMSSRRFGKGEIKGYNKLCHWEIKAVFPIIPDAINAWAKMARKLLNHKNPYTGLTWNEDPALITICPLNEDTIYSVWYDGNTAGFYKEGFAKWMKERTAGTLNPKEKELYEGMLAKFDEWLQANGKGSVTGKEREGLLAQYAVSGFPEWLKEKKIDNVSGKERELLLLQYLATTASKWEKETAAGAAAGGQEKALFLEYLMDVKTKSNKQIEELFKAEKFNQLLTGSNWYDSMMQAWPRSEFDFVDNHGYHDHPNGWPEQWWNQNSALRNGNRRYNQPIFKMPSRIFGKPFTISEYNFCFPNKFRAEGGAVMGAYCSLQDIDGIYRFAWSHKTKNAITNFNKAAPDGFDMATDPLSQLTEKQIVLLFGRGDVAPAKKKYTYAVTLKDAAKGGEVDMWGKGLFPENFNAMGFISQIGSNWIEGGKKLPMKVDGAIAPEKPDDAVLNGVPYIPLASLPIAGYQANKDNKPLVSDTGEVAIDMGKGTFRVVTPKSECLVAAAKTDMAGKCLSTQGSTQFASVSASAMDGKDLAASGKVLLFHLTNVVGSNTHFKNANMGAFVKNQRGGLPYLVLKGSVKITLKNSNPGLKVYAIDFSGKRGAEVKAEYADGAYTFLAETAPQGAPARMMYELGK